MREMRTLLIFVIVLAATRADAASGNVYGQLWIYQNQGQFCPFTRDCTGARYTESEFNSYSPVSHAKIYVIDHTTKAVLGQGTTDLTGTFNMSWTSTTYPVTAEIVWHAEHKDGRFSVQTPTGARWHLWSTEFALVNGTSAGAPQQLPSMKWGSPGAPNDIANVYDGAWRTWWYALSSSNRMYSNFIRISIRAFDSVTCPSSCSNGSQSRITLDDNAAYTPQSRVMHEMGHMAVYKSKPYKSASVFCYPAAECAPGDGGWAHNDAEWKASGFNEGIASFVASTVLYSPQAVAPYDCVIADASPCPQNGFDLERSNGASCDTVAEEHRWPLSTERFLWDIYDQVEENFIFSGDFDSRPQWELFDRLANFGSGTNDHEVNEPFDATLSYLDDRDGRSSEDVKYWYEMNGFNAFNQRAINCNP